MQQSQRATIILDYVNKHRFASVQQLVDATSASIATVRRDLVRMDEQGMIHRERGGITSLHQLDVQPTTQGKINQHIDLKDCIAEAALNFISNSDMLFLDAGTTSLALAKKLTKFNNLTIITPDLRIALFLSEFTNFDVITIGGFVDHYSQSIVSPMFDVELASITPTITFCTCSAFNAERGVMSPSYKKFVFKKRLSTMGLKRILLVDSSKNTCLSRYNISPLSNYDMIITDSGILDQQNNAIQLQTDLVIAK